MESATDFDKTFYCTLLYLVHSKFFQMTACKCYPSVFYLFMLLFLATNFV